MNGNEINFSLRKIITCEFGTFESVVVEENNIRLNFNVKFRVTEENRIVACITKFEFLSNEVPFIILSAICEFAISPESWKEMINHEIKKITIPIALSTHLTFLTVGTARGILHSKTENTPFNKYFLPTLNVSEIIKNNIEMDL